MVLTANTTIGKPKLRWETIDGAKSYRIYRATSADGSYTTLKTVTTVTFTDTTAKAGTKYYYKVKAFHKDSEANSVCSAVVSRVCDLPKPEVILSVNTSTGKPKLTWEEITGAEKYRIYRASSEDDTFRLLKTTTSETYTDTTAEAGTEYYYEVKAVHAKSAADSAYSTEVSRVCDLAKPVVSITRSNCDPKISWKTVSGAEKYYVYRATSKNGTYTKVYTAKSARSYKDTKATAGKTYYYKVCAIYENSAANSAYSSVKHITAK